MEISWRFRATEEKIRDGREARPFPQGETRQEADRMEKIDLLKRHQEWANRAFARTLGILVVLSVPMLFFLTTIPLMSRLLCMLMAVAFWVTVVVFSRVPALKPYTRYIAALAVNSFALALLYLLDKENTTIPYLFLSLLTLSLIYLDRTAVLFAAGNGALYMTFFFLTHREIMLASYRPRTLVYIILVYLTAVPAMYVAASRAKRLLLELSERELQQKEMNDTLTRVLGDTAAASVGLKQTSGNLSTRSAELQASAEEVAAGMEQMTRMVDIQAGEVSQVSASVSEINSLAQNIVGRTQELTTAFQQTVDASEQGVGLAQSALTGMSGIGATVGELAAVAQRLKDNSLKVTEITALLSGLMEQTNLLSLNATIEAARADEAGKGFSVVADQIRKLSEQINRGAIQIGEIVATTLEEIDRVSAAAEASTIQVTKGIEDVDNASGDFRRILSSIRQASQRITDVFSAMERLLAQNQSIMDAAANLASLAEETAAGSEEISSAVQRQASEIEGIATEAQRLDETSYQLDHMVSGYRKED